MINTIDILKTLMNNMPWPIWIEDLAENIIYLNDKYESTFGVQLESVLGKSNISIFNKELIKVYNEKIKSKMSKENVCVVKETIDGNNMMFYIIPIKDEENYIQAFGMIIIDIGKIDENEINIKKQSTILRTIIDSLPESVFYKDKESRFIGINKKFKEFYNNNGIYDIIGKSDLDEQILMKPGKLTIDEFEIMKTHAEKGYRIINASSDLDTIAKYVLGHHEKWDGSGYPLGLKGVEIPLISRIINVVDSYDVMTNNRPYKKAMAQKEALYELERCSGTQFDPKIVNIFKEYMKCDFFRV